jgi:hypothetical protein
VSGEYVIEDFKPGSSGDILVLHDLFNELAPNGFNGLNPLIDLEQFAIDGTRVVRTTADTLGDKSWMRFRQSGLDVLVEVDATGPQGGSQYQTLAVLKGVTIAQLASANFEYGWCQKIYVVEELWPR